MSDGRQKFYIVNKYKRAMISLGRLSFEKHCPYSCAFCYVQDSFNSYPTLENDRIIDFLKSHEQKYNVIYISGDTDSFAPPRTNRAVDLMNEIAIEMDKDIWFSSRYDFSDDKSIESINQINTLLKNKGHYMYAAISISAPVNDSSIEPSPIPSIEDRIHALSQFHSNGIISVLQMRPFLPVFSAEHYLSLIQRANGNVDAIIGEPWYFHYGSPEYIRVMGKNGISRGFVSKEKMYFDDNPQLWDIWHDYNLERTIRKCCHTLGIPFFMHSFKALKFFKRRY